MTNTLLAGGGTNADITNPLFENTFLGDLLVSKVTPTYFFQQLILNSINLLFIVGVVAFIFMFLWGGVTWIFSGGDKAAVEAARGKITNALIGIVLLFVSFVVIELIGTFFGIDILTIDIGPLVIQ